MINYIGVPHGTRLVCIERVQSTWRVWTARSPCGKFGTFLDLHVDGSITNTTCRLDEGDETFTVRPSDAVAAKASKHDP